jgi:hypothetical protein
VKRGDALSEGLGLPPSIVALEKRESWGTRPLKAPPFRKEREKGGAPGLLSRLVG